VNQQYKKERKMYISFCINLLCFHICYLLSPSMFEIHSRSWEHEKHRLYLTRN